MKYNIIKADMTADSVRRTVAELAAKVYSAAAEELDKEFAQRKERFEAEDACCFLCKAGEKAIGFAEMSIRYEYVNGTETSPVGFLEGIFVEEPCREEGIARKLAECCEKFAAEHGCRQMASDCLAENTGSEKFHKSCGYEETERVICFVKNL
ncbi:MAG: GNAT family N-acetyltransferase [Ruminococcaceae bacterium]|nr:GNAT family N-acetyltransferase [Oscillospiraceae bacterium]